MKGKSLSLPAMGAASLICIFSVLCLVVFALLSISTVQVRRGLSETSAQTVEAYYIAEARAHEMLAAIRAGEEPEGVAFDDSATGAAAYFSVKISNTATLEVTVALPEGKILRWQEVPLPRSEEAEFPQLWDGGQPEN